MLFIRMSRRLSRGAWVTVVVAGVLLLAWAPTAAGKHAKVPEPVASQAPATPPTVGDTRANLQRAFNNEMNAKEHYLEMGKLADREGYPYVARLFRACARAEQVHADQHVHAIAWTGGEARALLQRMSMGTTAENLRASIDLETYEADQLYPAMLAQARVEHQSEAVRSMNFALAAEREHAQLLTAALETLDRRLAVRTIYVCPRCGRTIESLDFDKCPNCFTSGRKFIRVT